MLGLPGFRVLATDEVDGDLELTAERAWCQGCGVRARAHARPATLVRDVDAFDQAVRRLRWAKRRWRCPEPACPSGTWTESSAHIAARAVLTERGRWQACRRVGRDSESVAAVARALCAGWHTVMKAVWAHGQHLVDDPARLQKVTALGMDETAWLRANRTRHTQFVSRLVDTASGRLLDVVAARTAQAVTAWLSGRERRCLDRTGVVALNPRQGYARAGPPTSVTPPSWADHFHIQRRANHVVDEVRRRVQQEQTGHRGRKHDPLYGIRKLLLKASDGLDALGWARLAAGLDAGDPDGHVEAAWQLTKITRHLYRVHTVDRAREVLHLLYTWAESANVAETRRFARTVRRSQTQILNWYATGAASNGPTEAVNFSVKQIKRIGRGFTNFPNYRLPLLLHCGVTSHDDRAERLRGRAPRFAA